MTLTDPWGSSVSRGTGSTCLPLGSLIPALLQAIATSYLPGSKESAGHPIPSSFWPSQWKNLLWWVSGSSIGLTPCRECRWGCSRGQVYNLISALTGGSSYLRLSFLICKERDGAVCKLGFAAYREGEGPAGRHECCQFWASWFQGRRN